MRKSILLLIISGSSLANEIEVEPIYWFNNDYELNSTVAVSYGFDINEEFQLTGAYHISEHSFSELGIKYSNYFDKLELSTSLGTSMLPSEFDYNSILPHAKISIDYIINDNLSFGLNYRVIYDNKESDVFSHGIGIGLKYNLKTESVYESKEVESEEEIEEIKSKEVENFFKPETKLIKHINFDFDSVKFTDVNEVITLLENEKFSSILIIGHTDNYGSDAYNYGLGMRRALSVKNKLVEFNIDESMISVSSEGEFSPFIDNSTQEERARNRRVDIILVR